MKVELQNFKIIYIILISGSLLTNSCKKVEIKPNERGIIFKKFDGGLDTSRIYNSGKHYIAQWDRIIVYNVQPQTESETIIALSKNEQKVTIRLNYSFKLVTKDIGLLHSYFGKDYNDRIIKPEIRLAVRDLFKSKLTSEIQILDTKFIADKLLRNCENSIRNRYIKLESINIEEIEYQK